MAAIDDPKEWILVLFRREIHESGGRKSKIYPNGTTIKRLPLEPSEKIYGAHGRQYFFSPIALYITAEKLDFNFLKKPSVRRIEWKSIVDHKPESSKQPNTTKLVLANGTIESVLISDLQNQNGYDGRIGQLFHQMIEHHGSLNPLQVPTPKHLKGISTAVGQNKPHNRVPIWSGNIICPCEDNNSFEISTNDFLVRETAAIGSEQEHQQCVAQCDKCGQRLALFDSSKHGYNASICKNKPNASQRQNLETVLCACGGKTHKANCSAIYDEDDVKNATHKSTSNKFGAFSVDLTCGGCGKQSTIIEYETS